MRNTRWLNQSQPQTLVNACLLLYLTAAFELLFSRGLVLGLGALLIAGKVAGGWGIANEHKWGYGLAVAVSVLTILPALIYVITSRQLPFGLLLAYAFDLLLVALLLHHQSRQYQRIWFR